MHAIIILGKLVNEDYFDILYKLIVMKSLDQLKLDCPEFGSKQQSWSSLRLHSKLCLQNYDSIRLRRVA